MWWVFHKLAQVIYINLLKMLFLTLTNYWIFNRIAVTTLSCCRAAETVTVTQTELAAAAAAAAAGTEQRRVHVVRSARVIILWLYVESDAS